MKYLPIFIIISVAFIFGYATGSNHEKSIIEGMINYAGNTESLLKSNGNYYDVILYKSEECTNNNDCVLTIIADIDIGYYLFNRTAGGNLYKDGYYKGLHEGVDMGWDVAYTRIKEGCK